MSEETITPVRHGLISGTATTAVEGARHGIGGLIKGALWGGLAAFGVSTALLTGGALLFGTAFFPALMFGALTTTLVSAVLIPFGGGLIGSGLELGAGIGGLLGLVRGTSRGMQRVSEERGAANMLDAQVAAYQAQAMASQQATTIYAPSASNNNSFPATMNQAGTRIQADTAQNLGTINGQQMQLA